MARARCSPGTNPVAPPASAPAMATPSALPICRALLSSPAAAPPRLAGAASITAVVTAGMVSAIPEPAATMGRISIQYDVPCAATIRPSSPAAPRLSPVIMVIRGPRRAVSRPDSTDATGTAAASGSSDSPAISGDSPRTDWRYRLNTNSWP